MSTSKEVAVQETDQLPAHLRELLSEHVGEGVSSAAEDNLIPLIYVLQAQSPQCNKRGADYVENAESGSLWLRSSGLPAVSGEVGIKFQHCYFSKDWVEWKPNRGGFVGRHDVRPEEAVLTHTPTPQDPDKKSWLLPNGNVVVETKYHIGNVYLPDGKIMPYVIPLSSSGLSVSKEWMFLINNKIIPGGVAPGYACFYRLKTKEVTNPKGTWMRIIVSDEGWVTEEADIMRGINLYKSFKAGEKAIDVPEDDSGSSSSSASDSASM